MFLCIVVVTLLIGLPIQASAGSPCDNLTAQAHAWLKSTSWRPVHPEDLKIVPELSRRAVLSLLPAEVRSSLWREFFESYLVDHRELTGQQILILSTAIDLASPEYFAIRPGDTQWAEKVDKPTRELMRQARQVFSPLTVQAIFIDMGKVLATDSNPTPIYACDCNIAYNNCGIPGHSGTCKAGSCLTSQRCGAMGNQNCDGQCDFSVATPGVDSTP
jgi:hypothetical protein